MLRTPCWLRLAAGFSNCWDENPPPMIDILHSLDLPPLDIATWLLSKICFAAAAAGLVLYIVLVIRGRLLGGDAKREKARK
jgi:hypothetical protein